MPPTRTTASSERCAPGASGFVVNDTQASELLETVRAVARGDALLSHGIARRLIAEVASQPDTYRPSPEELEELTAREREVTALVARGLSNQEIAELLVISIATAKTHVSRALRKVDARDRAQLVALAYESGLVHPRRTGALPGPRFAGRSGAPRAELRDGARWRRSQTFSSVTASC